MRRLTICVSLMITIPAFAQREFGFDNTKSSGQPYMTPAETVKRMKVAEEFEVKLFAGEPLVTNPIAFTIDEKGRVWVVESFEYPRRTPKGKMPRDRIVILEDTDGDGVCDSRKVFAEGKDFPVSFDMASGIEVGNGGVYLGAPPYLWHIENKNDKPGKFEILLRGFGSEDTHETLNTFQWGPDGWLYGLHGVFTNSTVTPGEPGAAGNGGNASVKMNAAVWRYHPKSKKFEIFAEGTSNPWGMDWRNTDGEFILCCCVIPHLFHMVPGGIYKRQAGASFNPYSYGEIKEICDHTFHRESGWAHAGLISLDVPHMPERFRNSVIFGSIHGCSIKQNILKRNGSTFTASRGDDFLVSGDKNFRPINMKWGPAGDIYLIDWHDQNPCHQTKPDDWDYERGRVYRIQLKGTKTKKAEDLGALDAEKVAGQVNAANPYVARTALRLTYEHFADKPIPFVNTPRLKSWTEVRDCFAMLGKMPNASGVGRSDSPGAQAWAVRFAGQAESPNERLFRELALFAKEAEYPWVRRELASVAVRYKDKPEASGYVRQLLDHAADHADPLIPLLLWTAYEPTLAAHGVQEMAWLGGTARTNKLVVDHIIQRAARRLATSVKAADLDACVTAAAKSDVSEVRRRILEGLSEGLKGRMVDAPPAWQSAAAAFESDTDADTRRHARALAVAFRDPAAVTRALRGAADKSLALPERIDAVRSLATLRPDAGLSLLLGMLGQEPELELAAVRSLDAYDDAAVPAELVKRWAKFPIATRAEAANVLAGRKAWAKALLDAVTSKKVARQDLTDNTILRIRSFNDRGLNEQVEKVWGRFRATPKELDAFIARMRSSLSAGPASFERGRKVFDQHCMKCHIFEGRGSEVGPALDGAARDIEYLMGNVLDPNRVIGQPYFVHVIERKNGTNEIGLLAAEDDQTITLKVEQGVKKVIPKKDIESHTVQEKSMMPEGLAAGMTTQDFRDLLRYVMVHPFINHVNLDGKAITVGTPGRIPLPKTLNAGKSRIVADVTAPAAMKTRLQLGGNATLMVTLNGKKVYDARPDEDRPDSAGVEVELKAGTNRLEIDAAYNGINAGIYARFLDPDRRLKYPE